MAILCPSLDCEITQLMNRFWRNCLLFKYIVPLGLFWNSTKWQFFKELWKRLHKIVKIDSAIQGIIIENISEWFLQVYDYFGLASKNPFFLREIIIIFTTFYFLLNQKGGNTCKCFKGIFLSTCNHDFLCAWCSFMVK